jgi:hypothetical protein
MGTTTIVDFGSVSTETGVRAEHLRELAKECHLDELMKIGLDPYVVLKSLALNSGDEKSYTILDLGRKSVTPSAAVLKKQDMYTDARMMRDMSATTDDDVAQHSVAPRSATHTTDLAQPSLLKRDFVQRLRGINQATRPGQRYNPTVIAMHSRGAMMETPDTTYESHENFVPIRHTQTDIDEILENERESSIEDIIDKALGDQYLLKEVTLRRHRSSETDAQHM